MKVFNDDMKLAIEVNEAIVATYESVKDGLMAGVRKIEDGYECVSMCRRSQSNNWNKNIDLATEVLMLLDLLEVVKINMRGCDEEQIMIHEDCRKAW